MNHSRTVTRCSFFLMSLFVASGCSSFSESSNVTSSDSSKNKEDEAIPVSIEQKIETGKVLAVRIIEIQPEPVHSYGNVGVTLDSSGTSGIQGSVDLKTIGTLYRNATKDKTAQEIIVKKDVGETVAITQSTKEIFKIGDRIKVLKREGKAVVIH